MKRELKLFIEDISESIRLITEYLGDISKEILDKNQGLKDSIVRRLEIIGEATKNIPDDFREKYLEVPWKKIAGLRDIIIHTYFNIDLDIIWDIVKNDLPNLKKEIEKIKLSEFEFNCIIIHECPSNLERAMNPLTRTYDKHWIPWSGKKLTSRGIKVSVPLMPEPWNPNYEKFKEEFEKLDINENSVLVGHSCGCAFLVRWLSETKKRIDKLILVAPWIIPHKNDKLTKEFYNFKVDKLMKERVNKIVFFTSDDEEDDGKKSLILYHEAMGGKIIDLKSHGHYTLGDMGTDEFPELLEEIIN